MTTIHNDSIARGQPRGIDAPSETASRWAIVLAGGNGSRMRPFIENWLGEPRPKQYCRFVGTRSMLKHTVDRAAELAPASQIVTIIGKGHRSFLETERPPLPGRVIEQPEDCGTAVGIYVPLSYIMAEDPEAVVLVLPSDHFIFPEEAFLSHALGGYMLARAHEDSLILFGSPATRPETDYGWILPSSSKETIITGGALWTTRAVKRFHEKPGHAEATELLAKGCLWNTMIVAGTAKTFWRLGWLLLPQMMVRINNLRQALRSVRAGEMTSRQEAAALNNAFIGMQSYDFSRDLLQRATVWTKSVTMDGVEWCDWGRPERVAATLKQLALRPAFPPRMANPIGRDPEEFRTAQRTPRKSLARRA
ncbi:MAG: NTP transferase domain-containing protein [Candidatus Hydrogenedentes bacterium]|nr:NTP transferase domain-containing protein [Candidatus Hydrogenedentota bacterium]